MILVAHDPGHGAGASPTGCVHGGLIERDWVLQLAQDLVAATPWARHMLLRTGPVGMIYADRAAEAEQLEAQLVISHHVNAHADPQVDGLMTFHVPGDHLAREVGEAVMRAAPYELLRAKPRSTPSSPGDWTRDAYGVLAHYRSRGLSVVLVEWGFATSARDRAVLMSPASRPALCAAGAAGIARAMELTHPG